jgi:hypothetical protein
LLAKLSVYELQPSQWHNVKQPLQNQQQASMKMTYTIIGFITVGGLFFITSCRNKATSENNQTSEQAKTTPKVHQTKDNAFEELGIWHNATLNNNISLPR